MARWGCILHTVALVIPECVTITTAAAAKLTPSTGKTPKTKPSKLSSSSATPKGTYITKTTKKIKLDSNFTPPAAAKSTPRKKATVGSGSSMIRTLSTPSSLTKVVAVFKYFDIIFLI